MKKSLLALLPIAALTAFACVAPVDTGFAAPLYAAEAPALAGIVHIAARDGEWHGYRGYRSQRPGYRQGPGGYWYPQRAFRQSGDFTGSVERFRPRLQNTCDYRFAPTNGSRYCSY